MRAILTYHSLDPSGSPISVAADAFARHVRSLSVAGVRVMSVTDLMGSSDDDGNGVAITFDDGFVNFATEAWPRLQEHGMPVTVFVPTAHVGRRAVWNDQAGSRCPVLPLLDWEALGRLAEEGVTVESHGKTHRDLRFLSDTELDDEVGGAADDMERRLGRRPNGYAYPFGAHDGRVRTAVARGADWACTTEFREIGLGADPHELPRLDAFYYRAGDLRGWGRLGFRARAALVRGRRALRAFAGGREAVR